MRKKVTGYDPSVASGHFLMQIIDGFPILYFPYTGILRNAAVFWVHENHIINIMWFLPIVLFV